MTLNATVTGDGTIAPTGTVTAHDGYALYFTPVTLVPGPNGTSTASISFREEQLPTGDNFLTFAYSGDANYLPGSSTAINLPNLYGDFTLITTTPSINVTSGGIATAVPVTVLSQYNFNGAVALSCTAPTGLNCMMATTSLTSSPAGVSTVVYIGTTTNRAGLEHSKPMGGGWGLTAVPALAGLLLLFLPRRRRIGALMCVLLASAVLAGVSGCSSVPPLPNEQVNASAGNYTVIVTGTSSLGTHNLPITVTVH